MPQRHRLHCFGIKRYYRYRDDVLMVCSKKQGTREFFQTLRRKVQPVRLQAEEVRSSSIARPGRQRLLQDPWISISTSEIRSCWPVGMVKRNVPLCSREVDVPPCKEELISRLLANSASNITIARVSRANPRPERSAWLPILGFRETWNTLPSHQTHVMRFL